MSFVLRHLRAEDNLDEAGRLFDAYRQFYKYPADLSSAHAYLAMRIKSGQATAYLAEVEGQAVGFMMLYPTFCSLALAPIWTLNDLYVCPSHRGRGIAQALLEQAKRLGQESGAAYLQLSTAHDNHTAQRVYEAHGWVQDTVYRYYTLALG
ncbi:N-acetyltransferase family protein [Chitinimonas sp.]|uniref:GNAT family N-acetyltransferase n=1 Tax=Chitinimonas sp. TaxID=1934313 RepID=UPI0035B470FE